MSRSESERELTVCWFLFFLFFWSRIPRELVFVFSESADTGVGKSSGASVRKRGEEGDGREIGERNTKGTAAASSGGRHQRDAQAEA